MTSAITLLLAFAGRRRVTTGDHDDRAGGIALGAVGRVIDKQAAFTGGAASALARVVVLRRFVMPDPRKPAAHEFALAPAPCSGN